MINNKYRELIRHIEKQLVDYDSVNFENLIKDISVLEKLASEAADILNEVRTGEDFEVVCSDKADEINELLSKK